MVIQPGQGIFPLTLVAEPPAKGNPSGQNFLRQYVRRAVDAEHKSAVVCYLYPVDTPSDHA